MIRNYFKTAFRNLWRNKAFSVINIVGLSVGLACCMLIFLYAMDEVSYDRFNVNKDSIYHLTATFTSPKGEVRHISSTGQVHGPNFKREIPELQEFVRIQGADFTIKREATYSIRMLYMRILISFPFLLSHCYKATQKQHSRIFIPLFFPRK